MAKNYRDDEFENDSIFGENEEDEYIDYDDEPADEEYDESDEWSDDEDAGDEYSDEDENEDYEGDYPDDAEYDDEDEPEYDDETGYDSEEPEEEYDDGSNYSIFKRLNRENGFKAEDDDAEYDDDNGDDDYYDDDADEEQSDNQAEPGKLTAIMDRLVALTDNDYIMYALLILLPPLGLLLMFYGKKWDSQKRTIWAVISVLCFVLLMYLIFGGKSSNDETLPNNNAFNQLTSAQPTNNNATFSPVPTNEVVTPVPTSTVHAVGDNGETDPSGVTYVYATNSGIYYHTISDCGGITNASKITLDVAQGRNLAACPDCAGGNNEYADPEDTSVTYYATPKGTYYHTISTCSGMTGASITTISAATLAGKKACPVCIGYYGTDGGTWYHSISNCQGMTNPSVKTESEWKAAGKTACPICMGDSSGIKSVTVPSETQVFATTSGTYFHTKDNCSGMKNASQNSISRAVAMGKKPCPTCMKPANIYVFATSNGSYYHTLPTCSGMKNAQYVTVETAVKNGKTACQTCASILNGIKGFGETASTTTTTTTTQTDTYVYCTTGGTYFHTDSKCSGMTGAKKVTYANAISAGKKACTTCVKASKITVFCTSGGTYYHTKSTCSGMTGATAMTAAKAISYGKKACTTCAKALKSLASADDGSVQVASAFSGVSTPLWSNLSNVSAQTASANSTVYIDLSGENTCYHLIAKCPVMNFYNGHAVTLEYAISNGINACPVCEPPADMTV